MAGTTVLLVTRRGMGAPQEADAELGLSLLETFFHLLEKQDPKPAAVCLYTEGVRLALPDSPILLSLKLLQGMGVRVLLCRTCLERYGLLEQVAVGEVGRMADILERIQTADKVVTL